MKQKLQRIAADLITAGWRQVFAFTDKIGWFNVKLQQGDSAIVMGTNEVSAFVIGGEAK
jgi:hypothetical protein